MANLLGTFIFVGGVMFVTLYKDLTINLCSSPLLWGLFCNASTFDNESTAEILTKGSLLLGAIIWRFILQSARTPQRLALQGKKVVSYRPRLWNSWRGVALIVFLFLLMMTAVASEPDTSNSTGENVPVGDRLPPNCHIVVNCGECLCQTIGENLYCCDA